METILQMSVGEIIGSSAGILLALSLFIEFTPIKWNPISAVLAWIGSKTNSGINGEMKEIKREVDAIKEDIGGVQQDIVNIRNSENERDAELRRVRILEFGDEVTRGQRHSRERFEQILHDTDVYDRYCREHPDFINNKTISARNRILAIYDKCCEENDFL